MSFKSNLKPEIYRSLNEIYPKSFPINNYYQVSDENFNKTITLLARAGVRTEEELRQYIKDAINGEENDFYGHIEGTTVADDTSPNSFFILIFFGMIVGLFSIKIFTLFFKSFQLGKYN